MSTFLSQRVLNLAPSATVAANDKAKALKNQGIDIINLTAGQPDFPTPDFIKEAAMSAIRDNKTGYTPVDGVPEIKQAIINKLKRDNQLTYENNQIIVSAGVKQCLFNLTQAVLNPGDEAISLAPYWVSYPSMVELAGATSVVIKAGIDQHFKVTAAQLEQALNERTKLLFINSPSNPTGSVYSLEELTALGEVLLKYPQVLIASDDIYEYVDWSGAPFTNILNACPELYDRTIIMNGVAKAHCMTGWRIGFAACHPEIMTAMKKIQSQSTTCATSISQYAAAAAFNANKEDFFLPMLDAYQRRAQWLVNAIQNTKGLYSLNNSSTFYCFVNAKELIQSLDLKDDIELVTFLMEQAHVATVPGSAFGCPDHIRLSFATSLELLQEAIERIQKAIQQHS